MGGAASREALIRAVDLALSGDWDGAHAIAQADEQNAAACWIHAVLHKIEGDHWNSRYWYRRTAHGFEDFKDPQVELAAIRASLAAQP
jgi:hypothetical protein